MGERCFTLQTACLFGTSAFTLDVLWKLWDLIFEIILIGFTWEKYGNLAVRTQVIGSFFSAVYCTFSLILAFFLFRGIHNKLAGVIKLGAVFVLVLRLWECAGSLVSWDGGLQTRDEFGVKRAQNITKFILNNLTSAVFVILLIIYYRRLLSKSQNYHHRTNNNKYQTNQIQM